MTLINVLAVIKSISIQYLLTYLSTYSIGSFMGALCFGMYLKMMFLFLRVFLSVLLISSQLEYFSVYVSQFHTVKESLSTGDRVLFSITAASRTADRVAASAHHENSAAHPNCHFGITAVQGTEKLPANTDRKSHFQSLSLVQAAF